MGAAFAGAAAALAKDGFDEPRRRARRLVAVSVGTWTSDDRLTAVRDELGAGPPAPGQKGELGLRYARPHHT